MPVQTTPPRYDPDQSSYVIFWFLAILLLVIAGVGGLNSYIKHRNSDIVPTGVLCEQAGGRWVPLNTLVVGGVCLKKDSFVEYRKV